MPALIGNSISELLTQLPVVKQVSEALSDRQGILGDLLSLVEALEEDSGGKAESILNRLPGIDARHANNCLAKALTWANNLARETQ